MFDRCSGRSEADLWEIVQQYADLKVSQVPDDVIADEMARLDPDQEWINLKTEGGRKVFVSTRAERNPTVRDAAIRIHGTRCMACGFCFEEAYGEWGTITTSTAFSDRARTQGDLRKGG